MLGSKVFSSDTLAILFAVLAILVLRQWFRRGLPPGPRGYPLIGNLFDVPQQFPYIAYRDLANKYGDVVALRIFDKTLVILNSATAAMDLLDKRSIYADRPASILVVMTGWIWALVFKRYGVEWRDTRRVFWQHFHPNVVGSFRPIQQHEARQLLRRLHKAPKGDDIETEFKMSLLAITLTAAQGLPEQDITHTWVDILTESAAIFSEISRPGKYLVESFPWLKSIPLWFPGTGWQRDVLKWQKPVFAVRDQPFSLAKEAMTRGDARPSMLSQIFEKGVMSDADPNRAEVAIKSATSSVITAGVDTGTATLVGFFCAMLMYPEVQKRAQDELDLVIGPGRLPVHEDRASLPYISAMVKESLRWHNVLPLGIAHRNMEEDEYRGWRIPKGTMVLTNVWSILHDPATYPEPDVFRPERFLEDEANGTGPILDPGSIAFGFGRRLVADQPLSIRRRG
ncbi:cytochrome P450 [Cubamyces sp. BRFM 1775]|nr:cytochrome P450 [Cubamyces sp. BRFM 1775]